MAFSSDVSTHHHPHHHDNPPIMVVYKECLKNHMASLGGYILDGCGEYMPSSTTITDDLRSIKCAACGCHRNFHRCEPKEFPISSIAHHPLEYQPHHHDRPLLSPLSQRTNFASPKPISIYPPAPHMVHAYNGGLSIIPENMVAPAPAPTPTLASASAPAPAQAHAQAQASAPAPAPAPAPTLALTHHLQKRFRTKFTLEQKEKMYEFSKMVGWKMQKLDKEMVKEFCNEVGVCKQVLKVWMHNNKSTFGKRYNVNVNNSSIDIGATVGNVHVNEDEHEINGNDNLDSQKLN